MKTKIAFIDRDGALIEEPQDTFQVDRLDLLKILPGVIESLKLLRDQKYKLVMVTNQNGVGLTCFPTATFVEPQEEMLKIFKENGINFERVFVCPHLQEGGCDCRKPKTGLVDYFLTTVDLDRETSFMLGDRETDGQFAQNLDIRFFKVKTNKGIDLESLKSFISS
ncbi:MAG: imidazole glycerol-phosphate dehydratase/histidinol phosphatase, imidazoleglycerol-phosphate dehydratase / histidinol-phosphatase [Candidatus Peregrinibacteria bacterium GW2011_GWF2_39_17]|nr:MAG: imidazole glycerol-phosphate dehydratase/histidinol phosphatase, imidazoleglycerol-phosphate dehydratase / histidinol-phosphatase [Candidatus Peregrinibacteria bacterium GW2011_GWF2_39_17]HCW32595.1 histidinol-phosphatase [Candidatus Peregrinibacteria bacterium]